MSVKKLLSLLCFVIACTSPFQAQQLAPTSGDVTVRLNGPIDFATARPLQAVQASVINSTNPAIPAGSGAILQLQNRDGSYVLKLLRLVVPGQGVLRTMSQGGVAVGGPAASGPHASLAAGAQVRFTLTPQDGNPGSPAAAAPSVAQGSPARSGTQSASPNGEKAAILSLLQAASNQRSGDKFTQAEDAQMFQLMHSTTENISDTAQFIQDNIRTELDSTYPSKAVQAKEDALRKQCASALMDQGNAGPFNPAKSKSCAQLKKDQEPGD